MGYQFVHLESYSCKSDAKGRSVGYIFGEASRRPDCSIHVFDPLPPVVVFGVGVDQVQAWHDSAVANAKVEVKGGKSRRVRSDQKTLHTVVASHPYTMEEVRADPSKKEEAEEWECRTIAWLQAQYGDDLRSVIRHEDESHWHVHAYVLPLSDPSLKAQKFHPGVSAKREVLAAGPVAGEDGKLLNKRADAAYKTAMRRWQDSYHEAVSIPCGHTRLGPKRRRLTRAEWHQEKVQARSLQETVDRAKAVKADGEAFILKTKREAAKIAADAARVREDAQKASAAALAVQDRAQWEQQQAQAATERAERYSGWAGHLRAIWDKFRESKMVGRIRNEFLDEIDRWRDIAKTAERKQLQAERQCYEADERARAAQHAATRAGVERDRLRSMLWAPRNQAAPEPSKGPKLIPQAKKNKEH